MKRHCLARLLFLCIVIVATACSKDESEAEPKYQIGEGFIRGNFDDEYLNYTVFKPSYGSLTEYTLREGGQLLFARNNENDDVDPRNLQIGIHGVDLENIKEPLEISPNRNSVNAQGHPVHAYLTFSDYHSMPDQSVSYTPQDSINYYGSTSDVLIVRITSNNNGIIEGTFEGHLHTTSGLTKEVTEGEFRFEILKK